MEVKAVAKADAATGAAAKVDAAIGVAAEVAASKFT